MTVVKPTLSMGMRDVNDKDKTDKRYYLMKIRY